MTGCKDGCKDAEHCHVEVRSSFIVGAGAQWIWTNTRCRVLYKDRRFHTLHPIFTMTFFTEFLRNPRQNASIVPSASAACKKMFEGLDMGAMQYVVELGPGTGCFTKELMARLPGTAEALLLEINPAFCPKLEKAFGHRFHIRQESAHRMDHIVSELGWPRIDLVVSGLPYTLPEPIIDPLLDSLRRRTDEGTIYRFFTYVPPLMKRKYEPSGFQLTMEHLVVKNVPPMWIYSAESRKSV